MRVYLFGSFIPADQAGFDALLECALLEKAVYELGYEANSRPDWVDVPARGLLTILSRAS